jgi:hypothetical protein
MEFQVDHVYYFSDGLYSWISVCLSSSDFMHYCTEIMYYWADVWSNDSSLQDNYAFNPEKISGITCIHLGAIPPSLQQIQLNYPELFI